MTPVFYRGYPIITGILIVLALLSLLAAPVVALPAETTVASGNGDIGATLTALTNAAVTLGGTANQWDSGEDVYVSTDTPVNTGDTRVTARAGGNGGVSISADSQSPTITSSSAHGRAVNNVVIFTTGASSLTTPAVIASAPTSTTFTVDVHTANTLGDSAELTPQTIANSGVSVVLTGGSITANTVSAITISVSGTGIDPDDIVTVEGCTSGVYVVVSRTASVQVEVIGPTACAAPSGSIHEQTLTAGTESSFTLSNGVATNYAAGSTVAAGDGDFTTALQTLTQGKVTGSNGVWSQSAGEGVYDDINSPGSNTVSAGDNRLTITDPPELECFNTNTIAGVSAAALFSVLGGTPPISYSIVSGALPAGRSLRDRGNREVSIIGAPASAGSNAYTLRASAGGFTNDCSATETVGLRSAGLGVPNNHPSISNFRNGLFWGPVNGATSYTAAFTDSSGTTNIVTAGTSVRVPSDTFRGATTWTVAASGASQTSTSSTGQFTASPGTIPTESVSGLGGGGLPTCYEDITCLPCHDSPQVLSAGGGAEGVCVHHAHMHEDGCPNKHFEVPCGYTPTEGGGLGKETINKINEKMNECCPTVPTVEKPGEVPPWGPQVPKLCNLLPKTITKTECKDPPARMVTTTEIWEVVNPPCVYNIVMLEPVETPCTPDSKINECWTDPTVFCKDNACATSTPTCKGDPACCYNPTGLAPGACTVTASLFGLPPVTFMVDGYCRGCKLECGWWDLSQQKALTEASSVFLGVPLVPAVPSVPMPSPTPSGEPSPSPSITRMGVVPVPSTFSPPNSPTAQAPATTQTVAITNQPLSLPPVICASSGSGKGSISSGQKGFTARGGGQEGFTARSGGQEGFTSRGGQEAFSSAVTVDIGGAIETSFLPAGYESITTFTVKDGQPGEQVDVSLNIPDNFKDIKVFLGSDVVPSRETDEPECGGDSSSSIRGEQIASSRSDTYTLQEMPVVVQQQAIVGPGESVQLQNAGYAVDILNALGTAEMTMSLPETDVPLPLNPSIRPIGAVLQVEFDQQVSGRVRVTFPLAIPQFIDSASLGIYVRLGTTWRQLESVEIKAETVTATVDDISLFLTQGADGKYDALFSLMGVYCASCPSTKLEKIYDGGSLSPRHAVVLIHGVTTDALRWQFLIDDFVLTKQPFQVWVFAYPLNLEPEEVGEELASQLEQHASEFDKLHFITHSMGGIEAQLALEHGSKNGFSFVRKVGKVIFAGQPGLGSPAAEVYGRLFAFLLNLKSTAMLFNADSPMLQDAVAGRQVPRLPGVDYSVIAGRKPYSFTTDLFTENGVFVPNDGVVSTVSARTVGYQEVTDTCKHYFEVPFTHTDLADAQLSRRIMGRLVGEDLANEHPDLAIIGYNKFVTVEAQSVPGTYVVAGRRIREGETAAPGLCNCGNGLCGEGETAVNCPIDCASEYPYFTCRLMPWFWFPLLVILLIVSALYTGRIIKRHRRGKGAGMLLLMVFVLLVLLAIQHALCRSAPLLGYLLLAFTATMLFFTVIHVRLHKDVVDDRPARALEWLLGDQRETRARNTAVQQARQKKNGKNKIDDRPARALEWLLDGWRKEK